MTLTSCIISTIIQYRPFCTSPPLCDGEGIGTSEINQFLCWFGGLQKGMVRLTVTILYLCTAVDAEQQEILELILRSLGEAELYYLRALLMVSTGQSLVLAISLLFNHAPSHCLPVNPTESLMWCTT